MDDEKLPSILDKLNSFARAMHVREADHEDEIKPLIDRLWEASAVLLIERNMAREGLQRFIASDEAVERESASEVR